MDAVWYFDFISPFAHLQRPKIHAWRERIAITPRPIVFAALLAHHGQLGPAEIPGKREFTYRQVQWRAARDRIALRFPPAHPFNSLAALRLAIAGGCRWQAIDAIFDQVWGHGAAVDTPADLAAVAAQFGIADVEGAIGALAVKQELRANTDEAIASGVFGVPTLRIGEHLFWGDDASGMIDDFLDDPSCFERGEYVRIAHLPNAADRRRSPRSTGN